jgi:hypothetical protein
MMESEARIAIASPMKRAFLLRTIIYHHNIGKKRYDRIKDSIPLAVLSP